MADEYHRPLAPRCQMFTTCLTYVEPTHALISSCYRKYLASENQSIQRPQLGLGGPREEKETILAPREFPSLLLVMSTLAKIYVQTNESYRER